MLLYFNVFICSACPVESTRCGAAHSQYCRKREHRCGEDVVYLKTENKPFTQNKYLLHFLEGHLSSLHSRLTQESPKPCKINVKVQLSKKQKLIDWETSLLANVHINSVNMNLGIIRFNINKLRVSAMINLWVYDKKAACAADRDVLFWAMCSFLKCITYISQVYSPSVNVRKSWKYFHFAVRRARASALRFSTKLHKLGSERAPSRAKQTERNEIGAQ